MFDITGNVYVYVYVYAKAMRSSVHMYTADGTSTEMGGVELTRSKLTLREIDHLSILKCMQMKRWVFDVSSVLGILF